MKRFIAFLFAVALVMVLSPTLATHSPPEVAVTPEVAGHIILPTAVEVPLVLAKYEEMAESWVLDTTEQSVVTATSTANLGEEFTWAVDYIMPMSDHLVTADNAGGWGRNHAPKERFAVTPAILLDVGRMHASCHGQKGA